MINPSPTYSTFAPPGGPTFRAGTSGCALMNGISFHGLFRPSGATFLVFVDYMRATIRVAALAELPTTYILTHDSIGAA